MEWTELERKNLRVRLTEYAITMVLSVPTLLVLFGSLMSISWLLGGDPDFPSLLFVPLYYAAISPLVAAAVWVRWRLDTVRLRGGGYE